ARTWSRRQWPQPPRSPGISSMSGSGGRASSGKVGTGFPRRSCSNKKIERDDDSKKSHHALASRLLVQPHILVAIAVIRAVHHDGDAPDIRLPARASAAVEDDRTGDVFLEFLVDLPD